MACFQLLSTALVVLLACSASVSAMDKPRSHRYACIMDEAISVNKAALTAAAAADKKALKCGTELKVDKATGLEMVCEGKICFKKFKMLILSDPAGVEEWSGNLKKAQRGAFEDGWYPDYDVANIVPYLASLDVTDLNLDKYDLVVINLHGKNLWQLMDKDYIKKNFWGREKLKTKQVVDSLHPVTSPEQEHLPTAIIHRGRGMNEALLPSTKNGDASEARASIHDALAVKDKDTVVAIRMVDFYRQLRKYMAPPAFLQLVMCNQGADVVTKKRAGGITACPATGRTHAVFYPTVCKPAAMHDLGVVKSTWFSDSFHMNKHEEKGWKPTYDSLAADIQHSGKFECLVMPPN